MAEQKINAPFGLWRSPVTAAMVSQRLRMSDVRWDSDGKTLLWLEGRSDRGVLVARFEREASRDLNSDLSVRGMVGYGGGDFTADAGTVIFAERGGRLYRRSLGYDTPVPLTPPFGAAASPVISPDGHWVVYVFSDGREDCLGLVSSDGRDWPYKLARGADFYLQPTWSPNGKWLAWVEWDHPNMPWNSTRLMLAELEGSPPRLKNARQVAGDEDCPAVQPRFSPDGRWLSYLACNGEWEDLVIENLENGEKRVLVAGDGFHLALPAWVQGGHEYGWSYRGEGLYYLRYQAGIASLWWVALADGQSTQIDTQPYTWLAQLSPNPAREEVAFLASSPSQPDRVVRWDGQALLVEARSEPESVAPDYLPEAQPVTWQSMDGSQVHGLFFAPSNPRYTSTGKPPVIVSIHGGPTGATSAAYSAEIGYFTSRGYAWLEVNYRGSTGYGRTYMNLLREAWGKLDTEDAVSAVRAMEEQGLADASRAVIAGGSAGGYTVLNALAHHPGVFRAGICKYGVSNLFTLAVDTHKFEERYTDWLVGTLPAAAARYRAWSPVFHLDQIREPMAIFQGKEDRVVVPDQSEKVVEALRARGIPYIYRLYEGEGHGFRKIDTIADYLQQVERFLMNYVLFTAST